MVNKEKQINISLLCVNGPSNWPSLSNVAPELISSLKSIFPQLKTFNIFDGIKPNISDQCWIFPVGMVQTDHLKWLRETFKTPYSRPRIIFFLGGEGAKLGHHLHFFKDVFRIDDEWVVSAQVEHKIINNFFPSNNRTHVLYYPVAKKFQPLKNLAEKKSLRQKINLPLSKKILVYAGRISAQKNIIELLSILEKFKNLHLVVCGEVDSLGVPHLNVGPTPHLPPILVKEIARRKLSNRVEFRGFLSQDDMRKVMQASDYQVSLSAHYGEDFGYSIAQGLACGLKTILSHWGGHLNWKAFFNPTQLTYIDLDWANGQVIGKPLLEKNWELPIKSSLDFNKSYREHFRTSLLKIIFESDYKNRSAVINVSPVLENFWKQMIQNPRSHLFLTTDDECFKIVRDAYNGN